MNLWGKSMYLANGLLVGDGVGRGCGFVAGFERVADECGAEGFDHEFVVVEGGDDDGGVGAADGSLDVGGRHFEVVLLIRGFEVSMVELGSNRRLEVVDVNVVVW